MTMKGGVHVESEIKKYQEAANKYWKLVDLAKEENKCRSRIKSIAQERAQLIGITEKYKEAAKNGKRK